ncbi:MAG: TIGR02302 family protein [Paracoccaceae bacterium]
MVSKGETDKVLKALRLPLFLTRSGLIAERVLRAFWPLASVVMLALAASMLGFQDWLAVETVWIGAMLLLMAALASLAWGLWNFRWPTRAEALTRLDDSLDGHPISALLDIPAIGGEDAASLALWRVHQDRMERRAAQAQPVHPNLRIAARDPFALRYVALLAFTVACVFGSVWKVSSVAELADGGRAVPQATWEGWIEPPRYTGLPTLYLNDQSNPKLSLPVGSTVTLRFYGQVGALSLSETVSGRTEDIPPASDPQQEFQIVTSGDIRIDGANGQNWSIDAVGDDPPQISILGPAEAGPAGTMTVDFAAEDDYGVTGGEVRITLDLNAVQRRHGLKIDPEPREDIIVDLPLPFAGDRRSISEQVIDDFSEHPWANLPVVFTLTAQDAADQTGQSPSVGSLLPARRFFDPLAASMAEQRRDLLWSRDNGPRVAQVLRAVSHRPEGVIRSDTAYLRLRTILRRLETFNNFGMTKLQQAEIAKALWDLALKLEEGDAADALERMRQAQERLNQAMRDGASDQEIAELMQELRDATQDYMRQLSREAQRQQQESGQQNSGPNENAMQMTQDDLQKMMDRIQELMEQGRMAEAQQALQEFQELMENMRVAQGQGQDGQSPGDEAMEGLADTLREQQGLSDQAFRDLQEQYNPSARAGENEGNEGRDGGQGRGQSHTGQGQGQGEGGGEDGEQGQGREQQGENGSAGGDQGQSLAERQQALRDELNRQENVLPGAGTPGGDDAREALGRAGDAMERAEDALRQDDLAEAIDEQAQAMEALRDGMRSLGEAMAQQQQPGQGAQEGAQQAQNRDPLGRDTGRGGSLNTDEDMVQGDDVYRRARDLLDEIRRRSGQQSRPENERNYLQRLLDRF